VSSNTPVEFLLRRDRWLAGGALAVAFVLCWAWLVPMARTVEKDGMMCGVVSWAMVDTWEPGQFGAGFFRDGRHLIDFLQGEGEWFFAQNVFGRSHGLDTPFGMEMVWQAVVNDIDCV
jgi:hypothetical protein